MRYASKEEQKGILPVMSPLFNLREICKQSVLLEDHLNNPRKRCPDCIRKHFLTIEAFYEEALSLDKNFQYAEYLDGKAEMMRDLQGRWLDCKDTKKYSSTCGQISQELRAIRKEYAPLCFDVRKLASIRDARCSLCKMATLSQSEIEEREVERLVRKKPKKKPPRQDLRRNKMETADADLEGLSAGDRGDRDLTMRSNKAASLKRWAVRSAAESKKKTSQREVIKELKKDPKKRYRTDAGNEVSFSTAWSRKDTSEYEQAKRDVARATKKSDEKEADKQKLVNKGVLKKEDIDRRNALLAGARDSLADDPSNMLHFFKNGSDDVSKDEALDILVEMTLAKDFPSADFGLSEVVVGKDIKEQLAAEKDEDRQRVSSGEMSQDEFDSRQAQRDQSLESALRDKKDQRKKDLAKLIEATEFPFDKKKDKKRIEAARVSSALLKRKAGLNNPTKQKDPKFLAGLISELNSKAGFKLSEGSSPEQISKAIKEWSDKNGVVSETPFDETNPFGEAISLTEAASKLSDQLADELQKEAKDLINSPTFAQMEMLERTPALKLLVELRKSNPSSVETEKKKKSDPKERKKSYNKVVARIRNLVRNKNILGDEAKYSDLERKGLADALELLEEIPSLSEDQVPQDYLEGIAKGFDEASDEFKALFSDTGSSMGSILSRIAEKSKDLWDGDIKEKEGVELGAAIAAATMASAYVDNFDFNLKPSDSLTTTTKDSAGRTRVVTNREVVREQLSEQVARFVSDDTGRRERALAYYDEKLSDKSLSRQDKIKYETAREGVIVSMIISGDTAAIANQRSPVDPFFLAQAKVKGTPLAYEMISEASQINKAYTPAQVRAKKKEYLDSLEEDDFMNAIGGESGPFGEFADFFEDNYCPDNPLNGPLSGQKVPPGETCPFPLTAGQKSLLRDTLTGVSIDHYTVAPLSEREGITSHSKENKSRRDKELARFLKNNKQKFVEVLTKKSLKEREEALAFLFLQMREANLKDLKIGDFSDPTYANEARVQAARKDAILKLIKEGDKDNILKLLQDVEEAIGEPVVSDADSWGSKFGFKKSYDKSFILRSILSDPQGAPLMRKQSSSFVNYQERANKFKRGMRVYPFYLGSGDRSGVVVQVFPAIGMVDVQFPYGVSRMPVEDLIVDTSGDQENIADISDSIPGGSGVVPVSSGPSPKKVASLYLNSLRGDR